MVPESTIGTHSSTIHDVARAAGVDKSTVSRVLNGAGSVAPDTRERIWTAARALHYRPSVAAQALRRSSSATLGLAVSSMTSGPTAEFLSGVQRAACLNSRSVIIADLDSDERDRPAFTFPVDAVVGWGALTPEQRSRLRAESRDALMIGECAVTELCGGQEEHMASMAAFRSLVRLGHQRIALIEEHPDGGQVREASLRDALQESPLSALGQTEVIRITESNSVAAAEAVSKLLESRWVSAIAVGAASLGPAILGAIAESKLQVGTDLSVVLFGDSEWARAYRPQISVVAHDVATDGRLAATRALHPDADLATFEVGRHWEFVQRGSFGAPRFLPSC